jgi:hypothetical protein
MPVSILAATRKKIGIVEMNSLWIFAGQFASEVKQGLFEFNTKELFEYLEIYKDSPEFIHFVP